jgi:tetratricopeptide (TPR) repeat protein
MDLLSRTAMELNFANNFETYLFPVLANHYLKDGDLERARKVCAIGLEYHPENSDGLFVLGQASQSAGDLQQAEQLFKSVLKNGTVHLQAATRLAEIQLELQRTEATVMKSWQQVIKWDPGNHVAREWLDSHAVKKTLPKLKKKKSKKIPLHKQNDNVDISPRLATFTMVTVLRNQGLHHQALTVLDILEKKGSDKKRIKSEKQDIIKTLEE